MEGAGWTKGWGLTIAFWSISLALTGDRGRLSPSAHCAGSWRARRRSGDPSCHYRPSWAGTGPVSETSSCRRRRTPRKSACPAGHQYLPPERKWCVKRKDFNEHHITVSPDKRFDWTRDKPGVLIWSITALGHLTLRIALPLRFSNQLFTLNLALGHCCVVERRVKWTAETKNLSQSQLQSAQSSSPNVVITSRTTGVLIEN